MFITKLTLVLACFCSVSSEEVEQVECTDDDFQRLVTNEVTMMLFYSPTCYYCEKLFPLFENARIKLLKNDPPMHLLKINCPNYGKVTCEKEHVEAYPTLKIYVNGEFVEKYTGEKTEQDIVDYMTEHYGYQSKQLINPSEVKSFLNSKETVAMGFFVKHTGLQTAFLKASLVLKNEVKFGYITSRSMLQSYALSNDIIVHRPHHLQNKFEANNATYSGSGDARDVVDFVKENYHGLVGHRTSKCLEHFKPPVVIAYYEVDYNNSPKLTNYWRNRILKVAQDFGEIRFGVSCKFEYEMELAALGLNVTQVDELIVVATDANSTKYLMEAAFSLDTFRTFVEEFNLGQLTPHIKSEPIPEFNDAPVKIVVGKNFDELLRTEMDVFILFYTPWCVTCLEFIPTYDKLAQKLDDEDVVIAKMNVAANDYPPRLYVRNYPTFYFIKKDLQTEPLPYNGTLDLSELLAFVAKHATNQLKKFDRNGNEKFRVEL